LRMSATVAFDGTNPALDLRIWGMLPNQMNDLSTFATQPYFTDAALALEAGDEQNGLALVFTGAITEAWQFFQDQPDCFMHIVAMTTFAPKRKPVPPRSYAGATDVVNIMSALASDMGLTFENSGVSGVVLSNPYLPGTAFDQMQKVKEAAGINAVIDNGTLAIWPKGQARSGPEVLISRETGMIGYPVSSQNGIIVSTLFNPNLRWGGKVKVQSSDIPRANGEWAILVALTHELECERPGGNWRSTIGGWNQNALPPILPS
jgi:hypothetical protein